MGADLASASRIISATSGDVAIPGSQSYPLLRRASRFSRENSGLASAWTPKPTATVIKVASLAQAGIPADDADDCTSLSEPRGGTRADGSVSERRESVIVVTSIALGPNLGHDRAFTGSVG